MKKRVRMNSKRFPSHSSANNKSNRNNLKLLKLAGVTKKLRK